MEFLYSDGLNDRAAVWIALHGAGRDETDMPPLVHAFAPGDAVLAPRGPLAFENGYSFFRKCPDRACGDAEIAARADHLGAFLADMCSNRFRGRTLFLYGCSSGAVMGAALLMRGASGISGAVLLRPKPPFRDPDPEPALDIPVLVLEGKSDPRRTRTDAAILSEQLRRRGARVCQRMVEGGHAPTLEDHRAAALWRRELADGGPRQPCDSGGATR